jgi:hypothetical protein
MIFRPLSGRQALQLAQEKHRLRGRLAAHLGGRLQAAADLWPQLMEEAEDMIR